MLVYASLPHGSDANLAVAGTLFEGIGRIVVSPPLPREQRAMGRTVQPSSPPCQTVVSAALQVAAKASNRTRESRPSGIIGGPRKTWPWRNCEPTSQPKGRDW